MTQKTEAAPSSLEVDENAVNTQPEQNPPNNNDLVYPDGGWKGWSQVITGHVLSALTWGLTASYGVYQLHYADNTSLSSSQISWIGSIQVFLTFGVCTISGRLADMGYSRHAVFGGSVMIVTGILLTSFCTQYWQMMLVQGVYTGLGLGIIFMPAIAVITSYFYKKRSLALALSACGGGTGSLVFPSTLQYLVPRVGFPWAVRATALVALVLVSIANILIRPRRLHKRPGPFIDFSAFKEKPYSLFTIGCIFYFMALYFGFFYINSFARQHIGLTPSEAVSLQLILNALGILSRPVAGHVGDRYLGPINTFVVSLCFLGCMDIAWIGVNSRTGLYVFTVVFGLANGAAQGIYVGALASLTTDPQKMGARFGLVNTVCGFATLVGPPIAGAIIDGMGGKFWGAQIFAGLVLIIASAVNASARFAKTGRYLKVKA